MFWAALHSFASLNLRFHAEIEINFSLDRHRHKSILTLVYIDKYLYEKPSGSQSVSLVHGERNVSELS